MFDSLNLTKALVESMPVFRWMMFWVGVSALVWALVGMRMLLASLI